MGVRGAACAAWNVLQGLKELPSLVIARPSLLLPRFPGIAAEPAAIGLVLRGLRPEIPLFSRNNPLFRLEGKFSLNLVVSLSF